MHILPVIILMGILSITGVFSANILYIVVMPSPSHHIWNQALALGLVNKGHNVTFIGPDENKLSIEQNYTSILLEGIYDGLDENFNINEMGTYGPFKMMMEFENWCMYQCQRSLSTNGFKQLLDYPSDFFDLIIIDVTPGVCFYPFIHRFNYPPTVAVTPFLLPSYVSYGIGNHLFPSYIPWYGLPYTTEMSFMERLWNFLYTYTDVFLKYYRQYAEEYKAAKIAFGKNIPSMQEINRHISIVLANTDPVLDHPQPVPPNIIPVGGLHTRKSKQLPQDLQSILDNAENGVILFSLGTNIRSDKLDDNIIKAILDAFGKIPETVIWKFESKFENLPKNVIVRKWLPQNDILGHPNVKLFIGHGGTLSTQETIFHGVPIVAIPFIVDQHINTKKIVNKRFGVYVDFQRITTEYFYKQIREVLDNPIYNQNMKKLSKIYKDRTETPLERGIFWIEYVLRHGGANFLSTPGRDLPFYKSSGLDVLVFLLLIVYISGSVVLKLVKLILKAFDKKKKVKKH